EMKVLSHEADSLEGEMRTRVSGKKQQYTGLVRRILADVRQSAGDSRNKVDLTVGTYALFGMMNWIYNWYDPAGKLSVGDLVDNLTRLFLNGFLAAPAPEAQPARTRSAPDAERLSVWRAPQG
ncbi:MAG TPA: hypothetical protein VGV38_17000, partial [Pyrinomonadaceae bacterium]|nr:hypothetical protein [Pyrinomonadaceae bacterium]